MSRIDELIAKYCPNGVEYREIGDIWVKEQKSKYGVAKVQELESGDNVCFTSGSKKFMVKDWLVDGECLFMNDGGVADIKYHSGKAFYTDHVFAFGIQPEIGILTKYVYYCLKNKQDYINEFLFKGAGLKNLNKKDFAKFQIPVPPLAVQEEIVNILDSFTLLEAELEAELEARKKQYEHYRDELLNPKNMNGDVKIIKLGDIAEVYDGTHTTPHYTESGIKFVSVENINDLYATTKHISVEDYNKYKTKPQINDVFMTRIGSIGSCAIVNKNEDLAYYVSLALIRPNTKQILSKYVKYVIESKTGQRELAKRTLVTAVPIKINLSEIGKIQIPVPSLAEQERIVSILDKFDVLVNDISDGLPAEINARRQQYEYYRNKLLNFEPLAVA